MIRIGLIGSESMHAWAYARVCNVPKKDGSERLPGVKVEAVYGVDDTEEHLEQSRRKGKIPFCAGSFEELYERCNAFMILQRKGGEHIRYAAEIIKRGAPVFIDKPVCSSYADIRKLRELAAGNGCVICGGSGFKNNGQIRHLKQELEQGTYGKIKGGMICYLADIKDPHDGIFFYLPHAVEIMLELFGYDPVSVKTAVFSHDNFVISVKYDNYRINLILNGCSTVCVVINGRKSIMKKINGNDIFLNTMESFAGGIESGRAAGDVEKLIKSSLVILAVKESMEKGVEVGIRA